MRFLTKLCEFKTPLWTIGLRNPQHLEAAWEFPGAVKYAAESAMLTTPELATLEVWSVDVRCIDVRGATRTLHPRPTQTGANHE